MLKEALQYLLEVTDSKKKPIRIDGKSNHTTYLIDGVEKSFADDLPTRNHKASSLEAIKHYSKNSMDPVIWHHGNLVALVMNDTQPDPDFGEGHRGDMVTWKLTGSQKIDAVAVAGQKRSHPEFVRFIVKNFRNELAESQPDLLGTIRQLNFSQNIEAEGNVQHGSESMGRSIKQKVTGATELPETVHMKLRRWAEVEIYANYEFLLNVDLDNQKISLELLADSGVEAEYECQRQLGAYIKEKISGAVVLPGTH